MSFRKHVIHTRLTDHQGQENDSYQNLTAGKGLIIDATTNFAASDEPCAFDLDVSECVSLYMLADKPTTVVTNSGGGETLNLAANRAYQWDNQSPEPLHFASDILDLELTNTGGANGSLKIRALVDPTP